MTTALFTHPSCELHDMGRHHPEQPARLRAVLSALADPSFTTLDRRVAPAATRDQLCLVHDPALVDALLAAVPAEGLRQVDGDTALCPHSGTAALHAAGAVIAAVDAVLAGQVRNAFCAVRPPGHHAEPDQAMGFCLFNNVAIGSMHARAAHSLRRIAVVDFDVHHGNGTQAAFWSDPDLFFASTHQAPLYPGTGAAHETGVAGNVVNLPLPPGSDGIRLRRAFERHLLPALAAFKPELLLVSAGFDAHVDDPLAGLEFTEDDYAWMTERLVEAADVLCSGRLVSTLEGGYDLAALGRSAAAHVRALMAA